MNKELRYKINRGEIDINNLSSFFSILIKGFIYNINNKIFLREKPIPHYILNTGDDIMYLEYKGQDASIEPREVSNESYVYSQIPRCVMNPGGIDYLTDQLTSPYTRGSLVVEYNNELTSFTAEYRRMPLRLNISLKYYLDNFTDSLQVTQQILSKLAFIQVFNISYMGQNILCSYKIPDTSSIEKIIEFDGGTQEQKARTITLDIDIETNFPVYDAKTAVESDLLIANMRGQLIVSNATGDVKNATREKIDLNFV